MSAIDEPSGNGKRSKKKVAQQNTLTIGIVKVLLNLTFRCFVQHQRMIGYVT